MFLKFLPLIFGLFVLASPDEDMSDKQVWEVAFDNGTQPGVVQKIGEFHADDKIDLFKLTNEKAVFMLNPVLDEDVGLYFESEGLPIKVVADNMEVVLEEMSAENRRHRETRATGCGCISASELPSDYYMLYEEIEEYLFQLDLLYPSVTLTSIGKTIENKDIWMITVTPSSPDRVIFIEGGIHAREWISPSVTLHIIDMIVKTPFDLDTVQYNIVPVANPDGYAYSHINANTRLWRKNRRVNSGSSCRGVDLNRNWDFYFGYSGTSTNPCSNVYRGTSGFSEPETTAIKNAMLNTGYPTAVMLSIHSYSQLMLYTYGYATSATPPEPQNSANIALAQTFVNTVKTVNNVTYLAEKATDLYPAAGATDDWAMGVLGAYYAFTVELRDKGTFGFELPAIQIVPTRNEIWAGFQDLVSAAKALSIPFPS